MKKFNSRKLVIQSVFIIVISILIIDLFIIQIINSKYKYSAKNNTIRYEAQPSVRGLIYDRNDSLLVSNIKSSDLMVIPREVTKMDTLKLCKFLKIDILRFRERLEESSNYSLYKASLFSKEIDPQSSAMIKESLHEFNGFYIRNNTVRDYKVNIAAHVLGYLGEINKENESIHKYFTNGDLEGKSGVEAAYDKDLRGEKGMNVILVDAHNRPQGSLNNKEHDSIPMLGEDIHITLDINLQEFATQLIDSIGKIGSIIAIEPNSGEILTLISYPHYDPSMMTGRQRNKKYDSLYKHNDQPFFNRALSGRYPPASPFKLVNALIGLQEKTLDKTEKYACNQGYIYGKNKEIQRCRIHLNYPSSNKNINLKDAIKLSCNSYFCNVWEDLFKNKDESITYTAWRNHVTSFGFGRYLGHDFIEGSSGNIPTLKEVDDRPGIWYWGTLLPEAIGQGALIVTPMHLANLAAIIANRGSYKTPHIIKKIGGLNRVPKEFNKVHYTTIDEKYFEVIIEGMRSVLKESDGTAHMHNINNISICGKTGTAQNNKKEDHSVFIGFAPKDNPKIAISVYIENSGSGSEVAAPIATKIIKKYLESNK